MSKINEFMYKITKQGKDADGKDFWFMERVNESEINENLIDTESVKYLDIPSVEEAKQIWEKRLYQILPSLKK